MVSEPILSYDNHLISNKMSQDFSSNSTSSNSSSFVFMSPPVITEKLTRDNYVIWLAQIVPWLKCRNFMGFVTGDKPCPQEFILDREGKPTQNVNPEYLLWNQQDQFILLSINNSVTTSILSSISRHKTSHDAWTALEMRFASTSQHRVQQLLATLYQTTRGESSVSDFLDRINRVVDLLALAGNPILDSQLVMIIMQNVGPKFEVTVSSAQARDTPISYDSLVALLLNAESRMSTFTDSERSPVALFAPKQNTSNRDRGNSRGGRGSSGNRGRGGRGYYLARQGHSSNQGNNNQTRPQCQICERFGLIAINCYDRMNTAYEGKIPTKKLAAMAASPSQANSTWYTDSGASNHITTDMANLAIQEEYNGSDKVAVGNGSGLCITHSGSSSVVLSNSKFKLNNILHCPKAITNLLSVHQFASDNHCFFVFFPSCFYIKDLKTQKTLFKGDCVDGLYRLQFNKSAFSSPGPLALVGIRTNLPTWHARLGHPSASVLAHLQANKYLKLEGSKSIPFCNSCQLGKSKKLPFSNSTSETNNPLEIIHSDVWFSPIPSENGMNYYVLFVDDYTRYSWMFPMKNKHEVFQIFQDFKSLIENRFSTTIKYFQSDDGGEYTKRAFQNYLLKNGIQFRSSCPSHPEQNGLAERKHRHIVDMGLTLLAHASLPIKFWVDAFATSVYLINRTPTKIINFDNPYHKLFHKSPQFDFLRTFGCACFPCLRSYNTHKLQFRSKMCVFIGYSLHHRGYRCLDASTGRVYLS